MKYFVNEEERKASGSTCYFEFQKGEYRKKCWLKDSICIHADLFDEFLLFQLFADSIGSFDCYGPNNVIKKAQWNKIVENSKKDERWMAIVEELTPWVEECFSKHECFTICGI